MRVAVALANGGPCDYFCRCDSLTMYDIHDETGAIIAEASFSAPRHEPAFLPGWLAEKGVRCIISGRMGQRAESMFNSLGIRVITVTGEPVTLTAPMVARLIGRKISKGADRCGRYT